MSRVVITDAAAGGAHTLICTEEGDVFAVGANDHGQLGLGAADDDAHPTAAQLAALGSGVVQVAANSYFSAALTTGGEVYLWGRNQYGQIANGECSYYDDVNSLCWCDACLGQDVAAPARVAVVLSRPRRASREAGRVL